MLYDQLRRQKLLILNDSHQITRLMLITSLSFFTYWFVILWLGKSTWYFNLAPIIATWIFLQWLSSNFYKVVQNNIQKLHFTNCLLISSYLFMLLWVTNMSTNYLMLSLLAISIIGGTLADFKNLVSFYSCFFIVSLFLPLAPQIETNIFFSMSIGIVGLISGVQFQRRLKMLESLNSTYKRFNDISEGNYGGIVVFKDQNIFEVNSTLKHLFQLDHHIDPSSVSMIDLMGLDAYREIKAQELDKIDTPSSELKISGKFRPSFYVEYKLKQIEINSEILTAMFFKDISDMKRSESIISEQAETLKKVSRLSDLGELSAGIAHEINNPLAIISGMADEMLYQLEKEKTIDPGQMKFLGNKIIQNTERISKIIKGLRAFVRDGSEDPFKEESVANILQESVDICQTSLAKQNIELKIKIRSDRDLLVNCRAVQLEQVLVNVINNAKDAISSQQSPWIELDAEEVGGSCEIYITDSGTGIPYQVQNRVFDSYYTTKSKGKGTGLGLSIARQIIEEHRGVIDIDKQSPNTRFVIRLPLAAIKRTPLSLKEKVLK